MLNNKINILINYHNITIFYNSKYKYPSCVIEHFKDGIPQGKIDRKSLKEPFMADQKIPKKYRIYKKDYINYMMYGGSYGHNAPAGFHKSSISNYKNTFKLSNICPQEVVFNSGLWVLLENWCKYIVNKYKNVYIFTGSISGKNKTFNDTILNIPSQMYKIILIEIKNKWYEVSFLMNNKPYYKYKPIKNYIVSLKKISKLLSDKMNFNLEDNINKVTQKKRIYHYTSEIKDIIDKKLKNQLSSSKLYGKLIYSNNIKNLENIYKKAIKENKVNSYHKIYYSLAKKRLSS